MATNDDHDETVKLSHLKSLIEEEKIKQLNNPKQVLLVLEQLLIQEQQLLVEAKIPEQCVLNDNRKQRILHRITLLEQGKNETNGGRIETNTETNAFNETNKTNKNRK
ncbi:unnamed protein product [Rotaria sp. Silwood2]|nr:unnamed protein product [Rotaria sp. Silwood2]CAF2995927.1 unnamed protein product [Rotaria sp. Silwood2]CAF3313098.1 unnamed protein product [Rotaria sp. Silwood2]CAF4074218.1 unnamed protein product [Rotaria sp. Silwood2]CAF4110067.1 unnamed protein product [Rotaria sp. Silwood2]